MKKIFSFIKNEIKHFNRLDNDARRLVLSFFFYSLGFPILTVFMNAFIWRSSHDFVSVLLYNMGIWGIVPLIFFINGVLLRNVRIATLYIVGLVFSALIPFLMIFFSIFTRSDLFIFGLLAGIGSGFYYANRNFLSLHTTQSHSRDYFSSLTLSLLTLNGIIVPFIVGWLIVFSHGFGYQLVVIMLIGFFIISGLCIKDVPTQFPHLHACALSNPSSEWVKMRFITMLNGLQSSFNMFFPTVLILYLLGNEGILGTISSLASLLSALVVYSIGKKMLAHHRILLLSAGILFLIMGSIFFAFIYSSLGVVIYVTFFSVSSLCIWTSYSPIAMDCIDRNHGNDLNRRYSFIVDQELFLNIGRFIGAGIFLLPYFFITKDVAIRFSPLVIAVAQIGIIVLVKRLHVPEKKPSVL